MVSRRFLGGLFMVMFAGLAIVAAAYFWDTRAELIEKQKVEARNRQVLSAKAAELAEQEERLRRLREDPAYVERELRRVMGYARPGEVIFRFEAER